MKKILKKLLLIVLLSFSLITFSASEEDFTRYRDVDIGTFKEYGFKMTKEFFNLKKYYEVNGTLSLVYLNNLEKLARKSINYLPDDIKNEAYYNEFLTSLQRGKKNSSAEAVFADITKKLAQYLTKVKISKITGKVTAIPSEGNAPLIVTLRADVIDPEGTLIPKNNYVWWIDLGGKKKILGNGPSINYTFKEQGKYSVFCDVRSNHKNKKGYTDVLSFRGKADINVLSKIASVIIKVNGETLGDREELKFTPDEAKYGLIFDATSTVPSGQAKIIKTSWDFGNGIKRVYNRAPKVERVSYFNEGTYKVKLRMETNLGDVIEKEFSLFINDPIATIDVKPLQGYLGDKFTFSAKTSTKDENLTYNWEIIDIVDDKVIFKKQGKTFVYSFPNKGYFNVKLKVNLPYENSEDIDNKIIYISSRAPEVNFKTSIPYSNKPNRVLLDASNTFDPDYIDNGKLKFSWLIDGEKVKLENTNKDNSVGYYTFDSIGEHSITLEVTDPDNVKGIKTSKVKINSILSVDFKPEPRVIKRGENITFKADSKHAVIFEWDFGDGTIIGGEKSVIKHKYEESGKFNVILTVEDADGNKNSYSQIVYVGDGEHPVAVLNITLGTTGTPPLEKNTCKGKEAYIVNRVDNVTFNASNSIDVTGKNSGLDYSIKINNKLYPSRQVSYKFDELGCFPVKLTVTSQKTGTIDSKNIWVKVVNLKPTLSGLSVNITDPNSDPVIAEVKAIGAKDRDGVITSYLWYYYTDIDSEPQGFRVTTSPETKFVLPKVTGNYYFVLVLTDENQSRVTSEELGKKISITLAGDNVNVPLVELGVNDNSVYIGEEVVFNAKVKNILGRNITSKSKFYWDFDGDGFYDLQSTTSTVTHAYKKSGKFFAKLKVKHKGFSNTRNIEINVANKLTPDFRYISIGNTFLFISTSKGVYDSIIWDLGDGTKEQGKDTFKHVYADNKSTHLVTLKLIEGTKVKTKKIIVRKNLKNLLEAKKHNFVVFSYPSINKDGKIILREQLDYIYVYPSLKLGDENLYAIDINADFDSDLNGGKDDDEDIKSKTQKIFKVKLNDSRIQKIVVFVKDKDGVVIDSKNIIIQKDYIDISEKDISKIKFINLTEDQKKKINYIKEQILTMPSENKLKSLMYLQRLQEEWNDDAEKTKVILEFEGYLDETNLSNKDELINILEGLLVENQEDKSEKNVAYTALKNLIPDDAICNNLGDSTKSGSLDNGLLCRDKLIEKLNSIKVSNDLELNKALAKEILASIVKSKKLSTDDKFKFKAILSTLVYGGVKNIPENEKQEVIEKTKEEIKKEQNSFGVLSILKTIGIIIFSIFGILVFITLIFFIIYKVSNKDDNLSFSEFIKKKTSTKKVDENKNDILSNLEDDKKDILSSVDTFTEEDNKDTIDNSVAPDWLKGVESSVENKESDNSFKEEVKKEDNKIDEKDKGGVPNWLAGNNDGKNKVKKDSRDENTGNKEVPDWLKGSLDSDIDKNEEEIKNDESILEEINGEEKENKIKETSKSQENIGEEEVPEWLKGDFEEEKDNNKKEDTQKNSDIEMDMKEETSLENEVSDIPDWLKGSLKENNEENEEKEKKVNKEDKSKEDKIKTKEEDIGEIPDWLKDSLLENEEKQEIKEDKNKKEEVKKEVKDSKKTTNTKSKNENKTQEKKEKLAKKKTSSSKKTTKKKISSQKTEKSSKTKKEDKQNIDQKSSPDNDLWDDGMEIPDWLKSE